MLYPYREVNVLMHGQILIHNIRLRHVSQDTSELIKGPSWMRFLTIDYFWVTGKT